MVYYNLQNDAVVVRARRSVWDTLYFCLQICLNFTGTL